ncbi:hypothetical protein BRAS3843_1250017 [Bradyrhizobium sp. STM 3843]|nr:hypothetical protein BRAS3843_1250017 [Bradyrhizobium sp. STM 3843]
MLRQPAIRRDLAAEDGEQRRRIVRAIDLEHIVARDCGRIFRVVVVERPDARKHMHNVARPRRSLKIAMQDLQQVGDLRCVDRDVLRSTVIYNVGGADQRELFLIRIDEDDATIRILQQIGLRSAPKFRHHDVASLHKPHVICGVHPGHALQDLLNPGPRGIDQSPCPHNLRIAVLALQLEDPDLALSSCAHCPRAGQDRGAIARGIDQIENDKPGVVHPAVGIFEATAKFAAQRRSLRGSRQIEPAAGRQLLAAAQMVIEKQARPHQPGRPLLRRMRQHKTHRPDDMRRGGKQHLALNQGLTDQAEFVILKIAQPAVNELARARRGAFGKVVLLAEQYLEAAACGIAGNTGSIDAAADDGDVDEPVIPARNRRSLCHRFVLSFFSGRFRAAAVVRRAFAGFAFGGCKP